MAHHEGVQGAYMRLCSKCKQKIVLFYVGDNTNITDGPWLVRDIGDWQFTAHACGKPVLTDQELAAHELMVMLERGNWTEDEIQAVAARAAPPLAGAG